MPAALQHVEVCCVPEVLLDFGVEGIDGWFHTLRSTVMLVGKEEEGGKGPREGQEEGRAEREERECGNEVGGS